MNIVSDKCKYNQKRKGRVEKIPLGEEVPPSEREEKENVDGSTAESDSMLLDQTGVSKELGSNTIMFTESNARTIKESGLRTLSESGPKTPRETGQKFIMESHVKNATGSASKIAESKKPIKTEKVEVQSSVEPKPVLTPVCIDQDVNSVPSKAPTLKSLKVKKVSVSDDVDIIESKSYQEEFQGQGDSDDSLGSSQGQKQPGRVRGRERHNKVVHVKAPKQGEEENCKVQ